MPQANITYDTPYNRKPASRVNQLEEDMLWYNKHQYHPSPNPGGPRFVKIQDIANFFVKIHRQKFECGTTCIELFLFPNPGSFFVVYAQSLRRYVSM